METCNELYRCRMMFTCVYIYIHILFIYILVSVSDLCGIAIAAKIAHDKAMGAGGARVPVVPDAATCRWESLSERAFNVGKTMTIPQSSTIRFLGTTTISTTIRFF